MSDECEAADYVAAVKCLPPENQPADLAPDIVRRGR